MSAVSLTQEQYEDYLGLRSRFLNLVWTPKRPGRQLRRLELALSRADPKAKTVAMSEPPFAAARLVLSARMSDIEWCYRHHPRSFDSICERFSAIFGEPALNPPAST